MNNVSHGVAVLKNGKGKGRGREGTKEEIRVGYAQDYEGGDIRSRERHGRRKSPPGEEAVVVKERMRRKMNISRSIDFAYISKIGISIITTS